jgi:hypothetical protein
MFNTPILFLIFNRPDTTIQVFDEIKKIKPKYLFIAADGPRTGKAGEKELCEETRAVITQIDWNCEVKTLFREHNLGCGLAVSEAITWFFKQVEQGIILEDDCLPDPSFFTFCEILLEKYKDDYRVSTIGACNYQLENNTENSYYFSIYAHIWGWATWRRTWNLYTYAITDYKKEMINNQFKTRKERSYWHTVFNNPDKIAEINTWDYQLQYVNFKYNTLSVIPAINLVKNIGFYNGTHLAADIPAYHFEMRFGRIDKIISPKIIRRDYKADLYFYKKMLSLSEPGFVIKLKRTIYQIYQSLFK